MNNSENGKYLIDYQFIETPLVINGIGLYQIGKKMCDSDTFSPPHVHLHWFELTIARSGKGIVTTNGVSDTIESGDIYLSFPYDVHSVRSSPENELTYSFFSFYFADEKYKELFDKLFLRCGRSGSRVFRNSLIPELVDFLVSLVAEGNCDSNRLSALTLEQLVLLIPRCVLRQNEQTISGDPSNSERLTFAVMQYLSLNLLSIRNLSEIADYLKYNYSYLSKVFKSATGKSITDYYLSAKMERAKTMICDEKISATKAAEMLNYSSVYSFSKAFKKYFGFAPTFFRQTDE